MTDKAEVKKEYNLLKKKMEKSYTADDIDRLKELENQLKKEEKENGGNSS